ncbi:MAG: potassium channel protein [Sandaracinus sp.]|nr:potassium channel protein [Sandaracinus sp.]MCB9635909.1 potassium channel protein [Sandaracinus sp.]
MADAAEVRANVYGRLLSATFILVCVLAAGTTAYHEIGEGRWSLFDCLYMTVITLSTVGFGETLPGMHEIPEARIITMALIVVGSGTLLYFISGLTALLVEGDLQGMLRNRRMMKQIAGMEGHIVVCGAGTTGEHVLRELVDVRVPFVVIERSRARIEVLEEDLGTTIPFVEGDATDDHSLSAAGIERARGIIAALSDDKDNLFVTISARHLNRGARIVAKAVESSTVPKLRRAGADAVVSTNQIGGLRLVSEMVRPTAVEFLDKMLRQDHKLRIEDAGIREGSPVVGRTLAEANLRKSGALVIAIRQPDGTYQYNPEGREKLVAGSALILLAHPEDMVRLNAILDPKA